MPCKEETRTIDGSEYYVSQLPASAAIKLQVRIAKLIGPALPVISGGDLDDSKGLAAIQAILGNVSEAEAFGFLKDMVCLAAKDGTRITNLDVSFNDEDPMTVYKVAAFVLEVNFRGFFPALEKFGIRQVSKSKSNSPKA